VKHRPKTLTVHLDRHSTPNKIALMLAAFGGGPPQEPRQIKNERINMGLGQDAAVKNPPFRKSFSRSA